ncbi:Asp-tRNA(Asn)/Glu-tRNA(Gln) amidotransferase subunit GatA [Neolewinella antarctica]|uniref:Glutamyl-tRNA(Gln) amidotransferase subunit A n=1 Tax=Neolewinella antarctica TaxID=442734 RepID=A0ABX0XE71_9BACT|nr:Asp-tRNA(Asn)/Glu-tRNA(Gln) amidotransferase subunit GatA [Neolewinella antarctica]NJC27609.1 aspartyl-tRNA(Asn)/glutamyl-tRNA(Gln) amidotransferase subunit A [Neolewinella antarctica]
MLPTSIAATRGALDKGRLTTVQVVRQYLHAIDDQRYLNIYVEVYGDEALATAARQDEARSQGAGLGRLAGVVVSIKDVLCYAGHGVSAGSAMLENFVSPYNATAVQRLLDEDAIIIGRTNCDEFAMGSGNENSHYGPTRNAADVARVPGGSSGGAAVSVQAGTCLVAVGSSTGGSVRQPASFCGVYGFKPTYGRISRHGLIAYGSSFDVVGFLGNNVEDIALLLEVTAGADGRDATAPNKPVLPYSKTTTEPEQQSIVYFADLLESDALDPAIKKSMQETIERLKDRGHTLTPAKFSYFDYVVPTYYVLTTAEASSNLSRYDGMRYGYRSPEATDLADTYTKSRTEGFGVEVQRRILLGTFVLSSGYYDAYYGKAQKVRRLIHDHLRGILDAHDFILMPVSPSLPWPVGERLDDPVANYLADVYTVLANLAGLPAIAIPAGTAGHLPVGFQLMADQWEESKLLSFVKGL